MLILYHIFVYKKQAFFSLYFLRLDFFFMKKEKTGNNIGNTIDAPFFINSLFLLSSNKVSPCLTAFVTNL